MAAVFPLYVELKEKKCVVIGGGNIAFRKIEILLQFEAAPVVIAPETGNRVEELERQGKISILKKEYCREDIDGAFLVIAATSDSEVNRKVSEDARKCNIPVNVVDDPDKCTFIFPSIVKRGDMVIGISTSGKYPALSKKIRKKIENVIPGEYSGILDLLAELRLKVQKGVPDRERRELILKTVIDEFFCSDIMTYEALSTIIKRYESELGKEVLSES